MKRKMVLLLTGMLAVVTLYGCGGGSGGGSGSTVASTEQP